MFAVVITGPPGAGKSSLATAVHDELGAIGVMNALLEVDELERAYPPLPDERVFGHVSALCRSYREAGHRLLFLTATIESDEYGDGLLAAIGADERLVVALTASPATLERRIRAREPATWPGLEDLVASAVVLAREVPGAIRADLNLDTRARPALMPDGSTRRPRWLMVERGLRLRLFGHPSVGRRLSGHQRRTKLGPE